MEREFAKHEHLLARWLIFMLGIIIMSFGIALMIKAELGSAPWDVLHVGLQHQFGLTVGTWSIIIGIVIIGLSSLMERRLPQAGSVVNMLIVGIFIDLFLWVLSTPDSFLMRLLMLMAGIIVIGYGIGTYIAPGCGAGPRDSLMLALQKKTGWKVSRVRSLMEVLVLIIGWVLGGPVFIGTILFSLGIGQVVGFTLPQCTIMVNRLLGRGGTRENINQRSLRTYDYDGTG
ncbi:YczE/YyaS/YitT family protein [Salibacterium lacus]|uniref:YitT family protein n=1 Tax=Salibacterium lacus TaxID=1898109 RepID=A0ABW5SYQ7_9BACI